jgi:DNA-directed RNA polymerase II subunit RPB2
VGPDFLKKALYIGHMTARLIECSLGLRQLDDRDSYVNKRLDTPGVLIANLFRQYYGKTVKDMRSLVQKDINNGNWRASNKFINVVGKSNVYKLIKPTIIEAGLKYGLATGNWGVKTSRMRQGVAQVLNRLTYIASLSHLRRVNTPIEKTGKLVQPRKLHATQWGMVCPSETPEGASVGLVKNLALLTNITVHAPSEPIHSVLDDLGIVRFDGSGNISPGEALDIFRGESMGVPPVRVYVNGDLAGAHSDPSKLCEELRYFKRHGAINVFTSIAWAVTGREVHICTDGGRFVRPLLVIDSKTGRPVLDDEEHKALFEKAKQGKAVWHDLVLSGAIEYLDGDEVEGSVIVMDRSGLTRDKRATHMEVSPSAMLGVVAGSIPYSDHNQAPRNTYQSAMGKQAIGIYASNYRHRFDTMTHTLNYPQKPMVSTHTARIMNCDNLPCGINTIVAIACFTGFNQVTFYRDPEGIAQKLNQNIVAH